MDYSSIPTATYARKAYSPIIRQKLLATHGSRCAYCGIEVMLGQIELDHFYPFRTHHDVPDLDNVVLSCAQCNRIKANTEPFSEDGQELIIHPYSDRYWNEIKINKNGIAEGKSAAGCSTIELLALNRPELVSYRKDHIADFIKRINDGNSAYDVYKCSLAQIAELLKINLSDPTLQEYFYRMIYANVIASMEAYLSKTLIAIVLNDDEMFWRFVNRFDWGKEKVNIEDIKDVYDNMNIRVQTKLTEVLYHNLSKVKAIYHKILSIEILQQDEDMAFLSQAIDIRHDLVHRNGRKTSNYNEDEFHSISIDMINELIAHVDQLVENIQKQIQELK